MQAPHEDRRAKVIHSVGSILEPKIGIMLETTAGFCVRYVAVSGNFDTGMSRDQVPWGAMKWPVKAVC